MKKVLIIAFLLLLSCSKVSRDDYDKIKVGMTQMEVEDILPESGYQAVDTISGEVFTMYGKSNFVIFIKYHNGSVIKFWEGIANE